MEIKHIKELMTAMGRTGTKRLSLEKEGFKLELERQDTGVNRIVETSLESGNLLSGSQDYDVMHRTVSALSRGKEMPVVANAPLLPPQTHADDSASLYVTSPMVGTFYSSPSPDDPSFVKVGDKIEKHTVVCIIEAMKVMNEVKASATGTIAEILVESGHPVEFGTKLFRIT